MISPLAYIHPEAKIGENVEIAPFVFIDKNVVIGDNNKIMANVNILYGSRIGNGNSIFPGAVIGAIPQDLKFRGEETTAEIGDNNIIRENVTINRGTAAKGKTIVGNNNLLMESVHVAHDALIGSGCIIGGDFIVSNNSYFRYDGNMNENISQNTIDEIRQNTQNSLSGCGYKPKDDIQPVTWITEKTYRKLHDDIYTKEELEQNLSYEDHRNGRIASDMQLEILDSSLLSKLTIHSGDLSALSDTSKHAIAIVVDTDDYGNMINPEKYPKVGDTLKVSYIRKDGVIDARLSN